MPEILPPEKTGTPEWHELRRTGVGASEVAAVMGISAFPRDTPVDLWSRKLSGQRIPDVPAMRHGREQEPHVADEFQLKSGMDLIVTGTWAHPDNPRHIATPDRLIGDDCGLEIKVTGGQNIDKWDGDIDDLPRNYVAQAQWCMYVTERSTWWLVARIHGHELFRHLLERDDKAISRYVSGVDDFLVSLDTEQLPRMAWREEDARAIGRAFPGDPEVPPLVANADLRAMVSYRDSLIADRRAKDGEIAIVTGRIQEAMGNATELVTASGNVLMTWRPSTRSTIDVAALRDQYPDIAEEMTVKKQVRTVR